MAPENDHAPDSASPHLLVVDDEAALLKVAVSTLQVLGYRVEGAGSGDEALELAGHQEFDLVLLDLGMPERSGLETLAELRKRRPAQRVMVMTGLAGSAEATDALQQGAVALLEKPFTRATLAERVAAALGG